MRYRFFSIPAHGANDLAEELNAFLTGTRVLGVDTYACRVDRGTLAAVRRAQTHSARHAWFAQIDIRSYFASIDHDILLGLLAGKFRNAGLLGLLERIVRAHETTRSAG